MRRIAELYNSPGWPGFLLNVVSVWIVLGASILLLSALGSNLGEEGPGGPRPAPWTPPGAFIGAVWTVLYTFMGASLWFLNRIRPEARGRLKLVVLVLIGFCIVWPFYAFDTASRLPGLLGNLGILFLSLFAVWRLWPRARAAALLLAPTALWITIATATILDGARRYGW